MARSRRSMRKYEGATPVPQPSEELDASRGAGGGSSSYTEPIVPLICAPSAAALTVRSAVAAASVPALGALICLAQMVGLPGQTWLRLVIWLAIGLGIYFLYGYRHAQAARLARDDS